MPDVNRLPEDLVTVALEFHRRRPWKRAPVDAPFLLRVPTEEWPIVAILIGQDASEFGVVFLRGEAAFQHVVGWCCSGTDRDRIEQAEMLSVTFEPFSMIPEELRTTLAAARFQGRRENVAPLLFAKRPRQRIKPPSRSDMRTLVWALRGILAAEDGGHLRPWTLDPARRRVLEITVEGRPRVPNILSRAVPCRAVALRPPGARSVGECGVASR